MFEEIVYEIGSFWFGSVITWDGIVLACLIDLVGGLLVLMQVMTFRIICYT